MTVGDVNSTERGSGARFNDGKPPFELVPLTLVGLSYFQQGADTPLAAKALLALGHWQARKGNANLYEAIRILGVDGWEECAKVFNYGREKYAAWNWAKGMQWSIPLACAARHLVAMAEGEVNDSESGFPHRGHVFCNIVMLLTFEKTFPEGDDRAPEGML